MDSERTGVRVGVRGGHGRPRLAAQLGSELLGTRLVAHMGLCLICLLAVSIDVYAQISAPTSCEITQSSFSVSNVQKKTYSVSSSEERPPSCYRQLLWIRFLFGILPSRRPSKTGVLSESRHEQRDFPSEPQGQSWE